MTWEYFAAAGIVLFAVCQLVIAALSLWAYPVVERWKKFLSNSQSIMAKSALIIFF